MILKYIRKKKVKNSKVSDEGEQDNLLLYLTSIMILKVEIKQWGNAG